MPAKSICYSPLCGHSVEGSVPRCPQCGARMRTPRTVRLLGLLMLLCGITLAGIMGTLIWNTWWEFAHPGQQTYSGTSFTGTADEGSMILQLFWLVFVFGIAAMAAGLWQMITARRDKIVIIGVLVLAVVVFLVARNTTVSLS
jgi:hypothetical protein